MGSIERRLRRLEEPENAGRCPEGGLPPQRC
jgi:hypothetical protein